MTFNKISVIHAEAPLSRRKLLLSTGAVLAAASFSSNAQPVRVPIADVHSHFGMFSRKMGESGFAEEMRGQRIALVAWKLVADARWIRS